MGNALSSCSCKKYKIGSIREITLLMIGLDNAGKTCTAKHLIKESTADVVPTIGFSSIQVKHGKYNITIYDLGGGPKIRGIWKKYYALVHGLIFVVDASDPQRLSECKAEITNVLKDEKIAGKPMLLLVNKEDIPGAMDEIEIVSRLDLENLVNEQKCPTRVEASCALYDESQKRDPGIQEGFNWLIGLISRDFNKLHERVEEQITKQKEEEEREKEARIERVRKIREEREKMAENTNNQAKEEECDDDDVIIGNPFKPCSVIRNELKEKEEAQISSFSIPAVKVIHVSPTNSSEANDREELILQPQPFNQIVEPKNEQINKMLSKSDSEICNGNALPLYSSLEESKRKAKKGKKRFKNRVVPEKMESSCITQMPRPNELPPLRPSNEPLANGHPCVYIPPKRSPQSENINWSLAEELVPCKTTKSVGSSNHRIQAWSDI